MTAKIMKEIEAIKITLATVMAVKLDWRLAMAVLGVVLTFFYAEMKEVRQELGEIKILLELNLARQGTPNTNPVETPINTPNTNTPIPFIFKPYYQENYHVPL